MTMVDGYSHKRYLSLSLMKRAFLRLPLYNTGQVKTEEHFAECADLEVFSPSVDQLETRA